MIINATVILVIRDFFLTSYVICSSEKKNEKLDFYSFIDCPNIYIIIHNTILLILYLLIFAFLLHLCVLSANRWLKNKYTCGACIN